MCYEICGASSHVPFFLGLSQRRQAASRQLAGSGLKKENFSCLSNASGGAHRAFNIAEMPSVSARWQQILHKCTKSRTCSFPIILGVRPTAGGANAAIAVTCSVWSRDLASYWQCCVVLTTVLAMDICGTVARSTGARRCYFTWLNAPSRESRSDGYLTPRWKKKNKVGSWGRLVVVIRKFLGLEF
ncbi:uncharacterized protein LOC142818105 isoform X2 [Rhipicephalus microplus]|uniref:uncharacterized protein LOC142818105 isoform X2 n=1 Tax=Rhipicephalus microplus TaxID=6941 RepID=UPI003F6BF447